LETGRKHERPPMLRMPMPLNQLCFGELEPGGQEVAYHCTAIGVGKSISQTEILFAFLESRG
jgi:hypothetical protein